MEYVDYNNLDLSELELIGSGSFGEVYKCDDLAIKIYDSATYDCDNIHIDIFEDLRDIDLPGFLKLVDYSTVMCRKEKLSKKRDYNVDEKEVINAYSSKFIEASKEKMIDKPIEYTLNTLYEFKKVLDELNKRKILISDPHNENVIINDNNLVIIDPDLYRYHPNPDKMNNKRIKEFIIDLWCEEYGVYEHKNWYNIGEYFEGSNMEDCIKNMKEKVRTKTPRECLDNNELLGYFKK